MPPSLLHGLRQRRPHMRQQWEALLRLSPAGTPLGNPDTLVHLIDGTLDEIFAALGSATARQRIHRLLSANDPICACGRNPLISYFAVGSQTLREGLVLAQADNAPLDPPERDAALEEINQVLSDTAQRGIEAFCGVCQFREQKPGPEKETKPTTA